MSCGDQDYALLLKYSYCDGCRVEAPTSIYNNALQAAVLAVSRGLKNWINDPKPQGLDELRTAIEDEILKLRK
jgi:hypothetical protein